MSNIKGKFCSYPISKQVSKQQNSSILLMYATQGSETGHDTNWQRLLHLLTSGHKLCFSSCLWVEVEGGEEDHGVLRQRSWERFVFHFTGAQGMLSFHDIRVTKFYPQWIWLHYIKIVSFLCLFVHIYLYRIPTPPYWKIILCLCSLAGSTL